MGRILMNGSGGGVKSDDVTASKWDVVKTKKTITTDSDDEVVYGTLSDHLTNVSDRGARINGSVYQIAVPKGAYRRDDVRLGAGQPLISDAGGIVQVTLSELREHIGYTDHTRVRNDTTIAGQKGTMPAQGAMTLNPGTTAKTGAVSGKYMTGNITVPAISISPAYIKKGQRITFPDGSSVTGTFEGWVPVATDLYYNGQNPAGFKAGNAATTSYVSFDNNQITVNVATVMILESTKTYDVHSHSQLIIEGNLILSSNATEISVNPNNGQETIAVTYSGTHSSIAIDISRLTSLTSGWKLSFGRAAGTNISKGSYIRRIRLA